MNGDANIFIDGVRRVLSGIDLVVYTFFSWVMQLIFDIVKVSADSGLTDFYDGIATRIYAVLAIYMLFKVTISLISYVINPDAMTDKERGVSKLITRIITSMVMLIAFPTAFKMLYSLQQPILEEALPRIVLGTNLDDQDHGEEMQNVGKKIAFSVYNGIAFNSNAADRDCENVGESQYENCQSGYFMYGNTVDAAVSHINDEDTNGNYKYTYHPLLGFAVGVILSVIMLGYSVDVSVRVFKLIVLQLIAPIPIISYVDPKSSKDGAFSKWLKMVISVWTELFIKMGIIYFVILIINQLITSNAINNIISSTVSVSADNVFRSGMIMLALVVGLLFFAKDAPKFICDALGIKSSENGKLFGGFGKILSAGAIGVGAVGGAVSGFSSTLATGGKGLGNFTKSLFTGVAGGIGGTANAGKAFFNSKNSSASDVMSQVRKYNDKLYSNAADDSTFFGRTLAGVQGNFGLRNEFQRMDEKIKYYGAAESAIGRLVKAFDGNGDYKFTYTGQSIKDAYGREVIKSDKMYSLKDLNDIYSRVSASGDNALIEAVDKVKKNAQSDRFSEIRKLKREQIVENISNEVAGWSTNDLVVYDSAKTVYDIASKYSNEPEFARFKNDKGGIYDFDGSDMIKVDGKDIEALNFGYAFKHDAGSAGKTADQLKNSSEYATASANAKRAEQSKK